MILFFGLFFLITPSDVHSKVEMSLEIICFDQIESYVLDYLKENLGKVFRARISIGKLQDLPEYAYNSRRRQYFSSAILDNLAKSKSGDKKVLCVIDRDLYVPELNFVLGEADPLSGICIISLTRLYQSYYGLKEDEDLFLKRALKEAVHEIGHLLKLGHCPNAKCVMHFSNSIADTDKKDSKFCDSCKKLLSQER
jgi:archaemetzincin